MQRAPLRVVDANTIDEASTVAAVDIMAPIQTPIGRLYVAVSDSAITAVGRTTAAVEASIFTRFGRPVQQAAALPEPRASAIDAHLRGVVPPSESTALRFELGEIPALDRAVLDAVMEIPRGELRSYGQIARQIGQPRAAKEVGQALNQNPIPVLIPCHRVVYSDGRLGGYAFGSRAKQALLHAEGALLLAPEARTTEVA